ncbi:hypothetical protein AFLA70_310g001090 [Aspergillus flavus AF70]|nr:hypothetical protein AFLA70_310g001090 [Aspergillus flavus AF70]
MINLSGIACRTRFLLPRIKSEYLRKMMRKAMRRGVRTRRTRMMRMMSSQSQRTKTHDIRSTCLLKDKRLREAYYSQSLVKCTVTSLQIDRHTPSTLFLISI